MSQVHELKTLAVYFQAVKRGEKTFEVRLNDRAFQKGDKLILRELRDNGSPLGGGYTGQHMEKVITYVLQGGQFGIEPRYCVLGLGDVEQSIVDFVSEFGGLAFHD